MSYAWQKCSQVGCWNRGNAATGLCLDHRIASRRAANPDYIDGRKSHHTNHEGEA